MKSQKAKSKAKKIPNYQFPMGKNPPVKMQNLNKKSVYLLSCVPYWSESEAAHFAFFYFAFIVL